MSKTIKTIPNTYLKRFVAFYFESQFVDFKHTEPPEVVIKSEYQGSVEKFKTAFGCNVTKIKVLK